MSASKYESQREHLINILIAEGILQDEEVIRSMRRVPREEFLPESLRESAYSDTPLPLFEGQTISAPHMVAMMCQYLRLKKGDKVLEVGAGSGYHAAVIAEIVASKETGNDGHVYTLEIVKTLAEFAERNLKRTAYSRIATVLFRDGSIGLPEYAPYDKILVTATAPNIPPTLIEQLKPGGLLVSPVGEPHSFQVLRILKKDIDEKIETSDLGGVAFVPLRGKYGWREAS